MSEVTALMTAEAKSHQYHVAKRESSVTNIPLPKISLERFVMSDVALGEMHYA